MTPEDEDVKHTPICQVCEKELRAEEMDRGLCSWCDDADECSICRRRHGLEVIHACE